MRRRLPLVLALVAVGPQPVVAQSPVLVAPLEGATGLANPVALAHAGDGSGRLFIVLQDGRIVVHSGTQVLPVPFLDIRPLVQSVGLEQGLLGLAFHPDYPASPYFFVNYTCRSFGQPECSTDGDTVIARFQVSSDPNVADPASRRVMIVIPHVVGLHNAGDLKFGPDGNLWIPTGDGGGDFGGQCLAQGDQSLRGKLLRIDVDQNVDTPPYYGIPPDNPYVGPGDPPDEVYARGLRNPYRFSFDRLTGDLFLGDVGENAREEIDFQPAAAGAGANYGWKILEGTLCTGDTTSCPPTVPPCNSPAYTPPILEGAHGQFVCAVIGGFRYRGAAIPAIQGWYLYGDYCGAGFTAATEGPPGAWTTKTLDVGNVGTLSSFGEDEAGELYFATLGSTSGAVHRILAAPGTLSVDDTSAIEGNFGRPTAMTFTASLSLPSSQAVTVHFETAAGTAEEVVDYTPVQGNLTFGPGVTTRTVVVPVFPDALDEDDETFRLVLSNPSGALLGDHEGEAVVLDDDPLPELITAPCLVAEGHSGRTPCDLVVSLQPVSGRTVSASFQTVDGTATAGIDYVGASGSLSFAPGDTTRTVSTNVLGDVVPEPDETFSLALTAVSNATTPTSLPNVIQDDDRRETGLSHGVSLTSSLFGGRVLHRMSQAPLSSHEVVLDAATIGATASLALDRVAADGNTLLQSSIATGTGTARSLRWRNDTAAPISTEQIRVSATCTPFCGMGAIYRLRAYDTTARIPRFNNSGSQVTIVILHNQGAAPGAGLMHFWNAGGSLLASEPVALPARGSSVFLSFNRPELQGQSGSVTVTHDAAYGGITGKAVALEPATGFSFDSPLTFWPY